MPEETIPAEGGSGGVPLCFIKYLLGERCVELKWDWRSRRETIVALSLRRHQLSSLISTTLNTLEASENPSEPPELSVTSHLIIL